jgi:tetratricopeptide (TPR) repeat protein
MKTGVTIALAAFVTFVMMLSGAAGQERDMDASTLLKTGDSLFSQDEYDQSREYYEKAAERAQADGQNSELTEAYSMIARSYLITNKKEEGREWIAKAREIATSDEPLGWSRYIGVRGRFEWQDKELDKATGTFKDMYEFCSENKLHNRAIDAAHMVAITGDHETQVEWGLKGIKEAEEGNVTGWLGPLWNNLGGTYDELGEYEKSLDAYMKARDYHYKYGNHRSQVIADWAVGHAQRMNGNFDEAEKWVKPLLPKFEEMKDGEFIGWCEKELGEIAVGRGDTTSAIEHLTKAEVKLKEAGMPDWRPDEYEKLVKRIEGLSR